MITEQLERLTDVTNRSVNQTRFLLNLLGNNKWKLLKLEVAIREKGIHYCPTTFEQINQIIDMYKYHVEWYIGGQYQMPVVIWADDDPDFQRKIESQYSEYQNYSIRVQTNNPSSSYKKI